MEKMGELIRVRGGIASVEEQVRRIAKGLKRPDRFRAVIERFKCLRNYLKYFGVAEEDD